MNHKFTYTVFVRFFSFLQCFYKKVYVHKDSLICNHVCMPCGCDTLKWKRGNYPPTLTWINNVHSAMMFQSYCAPLFSFHLLKLNQWIFIILYIFWFIPSGVRASFRVFRLIFPRNLDHTRCWPHIVFVVVGVRPGELPVDPRLAGPN